MLKWYLRYTGLNKILLKLISSAFLLPFLTWLLENLNNICDLHYFYWTVLIYKVSTGWKKSLLWCLSYKSLIARTHYLPRQFIFFDLEFSTLHWSFYLKINILYYFYFKNTTLREVTKTSTENSLAPFTQLLPITTYNCSAAIKSRNLTLVWYYQLQILFILVLICVYIVLWNVITYVDLWNHHHNQDTELCYHLQRNTVYLSFYSLSYVLTRAVTEDKTCRQFSSKGSSGS